MSALESELKENNQTFKDIKRLSSILRCHSCLKVATAAPIYECKEGHLVCHSCNNKLLHCRTCGVHLMGVRKNKAESLGNTLLGMTNVEVGNQVPPDSGDIFVNVAGVKQVGK